MYNGHDRTHPRKLNRKNFEDWPFRENWTPRKFPAIRCKQFIALAVPLISMASAVQVAVTAPILAVFIPYALNVMGLSRTENSHSHVGGATYGIDMCVLCA